MEKFFLHICITKHLIVTEDKFYPRNFLWFKDNLRVFNPSIKNDARKRQSFLLS